MERHRELTDLAALLDGELKDSRVEELYTQLKDDDGLREEFELQREVKTALSQLPEEPAPDFMATRVLGEIAARRSRRSGTSWRTVAAALGGFSFCLLVVVGMMFFSNRGFAPGTPTIALTNGEFEHYPVGSLATEFAGSDQVISDIADPNAQNYLYWANDQHDYSTRRNSTDLGKRDMTRVINAIERGEKIYTEPEDIEPEDNE